MAKGLIDANWLNGPVLELAPQLLGQYLVRKVDGEATRYLISEVEAYDGEQDKACHASKGRTPRTAVMYGPAGHWYVYLCYGVHWLLNIVTGPEDYPAAILIRGLGSVAGPGRLTKALRVDGALNKQPVCPESGLWLEFNERRSDAMPWKSGPRIGVNYAGPDWASRPYRFYVES